MDLLDLTLDTPAENLALDEALLLAAEEAAGPRETLRLWEPRQNFVVLGSSSRIAEEVRRDACAARGIEVLRRTSGGAAIVTGPGCLMYSLVLSMQTLPELRTVDRAHCFVLNKLAAAIGGLVPGVVIRGTSDLAIGDRKFSGNSLRLKRRHLLYHGTLLYNFPLDLITTCLAEPPRQPAYRAARTHDEFIVDLPASSEDLRTELARIFGVTSASVEFPSESVRLLTAAKFSNPEWTRRI